MLTVSLLPLFLLLLRGRGLSGCLSLGRVRIGRRKEGVGVRPDHGNPLDDGIERRAGPALNSEKVPCAIFIGTLAVVADDGHGLGQIRRDGLQFDAHGHGIPRRLHPLVRFGRLLAYGAAGIMGGQLAEAVPVDGVAAGHLVRGRTGAEQVLLADGTILHVLADLAVVLSKERGVDAHAAIVAVAEVFGPTDATEAALGTVVGTFLGRHPQVANGAVILSKLDSAADAVVAVARSVKGGIVNDVSEAKKDKLSNDQCYLFASLIKAMPNTNNT